MPKPPIKETELFVLQERGNTKIRIVSWNDQAPVLEKRMFTTYDRERHAARAKGFSLQDLCLIKERWEEIMDVMVANKV